MYISSELTTVLPFRSWPFRALGPPSHARRSPPSPPRLPRGGDGSPRLELAGEAGGSSPPPPLPQARRPSPLRRRPRHLSNHRVLFDRAERCLPLLDRLDVHDGVHERLAPLLQEQIRLSEACLRCRLQSSYLALACRVRPPGGEDRVGGRADSMCTWQSWSLPAFICGNGQRVLVKGLTKRGQPSCPTLSERWGNRVKCPCVNRSKAQ